jgi:hypothetical protein
VNELSQLILYYSNINKLLYDIYIITSITINCICVLDNKCRSNNHKIMYGHNLHTKMFLSKGLIIVFCNSGIKQEQAAAGSPLVFNFPTQYSLPGNELLSHAYIA